MKYLVLWAAPGKNEKRFVEKIALTLNNRVSADSTAERFDRFLFSLEEQMLPTPNYYLSDAVQ